MSEIHLHLLNECRQIPWTGGSERELKFQQQASKTVDKKTKQDKEKDKEKQEVAPKSVTISIPNWPYTKNILQELIKYIILRKYFNLVLEFTPIFYSLDLSMNRGLISQSCTFSLVQTRLCVS